MYVYLHNNISSSQLFMKIVLEMINVIYCFAFRAHNERAINMWVKDGRFESEKCEKVYKVAPLTGIHHARLP